jgi:Putative multicopper oxidases
MWFTQTTITTMLLVIFARAAIAATVTYNWNATWVWRNPDGKYARPVVGINNDWPCPKIEATVGDTVVVNLENRLGNQTTGLHFHGLNQITTEDMDGPSGVTQCPIPPNSTVTYRFVVDTAGTYWCMLIELPLTIFPELLVINNRQTTPTTLGNTPTACAGPSSSMIRMTLMPTTTTRR